MLLTLRNRRAIKTAQQAKQFTIKEFTKLLGSEGSQAKAMIQRLTRESMSCSMYALPADASQTLSRKSALAMKRSRRPGERENNQKHEKVF